MSEHLRISNPKLRVAVLGARGIGSIHCRIFHSLGTEIVAILGKDELSVLETSQNLKTNWNIDCIPLCNLSNLLEMYIDAVSICTPSELHYEQILACFEKQIHVFCEKPLFWNKEDNFQQLIGKLNTLKNHPYRSLYMNSPSIFFANAIKSRIGDIDIKNLKFSFFTNGKYVGKDIGVDLFTHGMSIVFGILGKKRIDLLNFTSNYDSNNYSCSFIYNDTVVEFDFRENPTGLKLFSVDIDGRVFKRVQEGQGNSYSVFLIDSYCKDAIFIEDTFSLSIKEFIQYASSPNSLDNFDEAELIMTYMAQHLI